MQLIHAGNAESYLRDSGRITTGESITVRELAGGVSNIVLFVSPANGKPAYVLKQVREQLRVPDPWFCSVERIWREMEVLETCHQALASSSSESRDSDEFAVFVPQIQFSDRENYLYAMSAAPDHVVWKAQLLRGETNPEIASACGRLLGRIHAATWQRPDLAKQFGDTSFFDALRLDPYYRHVARQHADVAEVLYALIESLAQNPRCLVHGDFSPKNILVHDHGLTLVDFEVGHFGDPAFDLGFFLTHLVLKAIWSGAQWWDYLQLTFAFWESYRQTLAPVCGERELASLVERAIAQLAGCMLARVDGKSRVEYLDRNAQERARRFAKDLLFRPVSTWSEVAARFYEWD